MLLQAKELVKWARDLEDQLVNDIVTRSQVICTTLISCDNKSIRNLSYDTMAIDEASQALEPECWVGMLKSKRIILAGDHKQLPPTIKSKEAEKLGLATTILDKMASPLSSSFLLRCQYRMNEDILAFPNKLMYEGKLYTAEEVKNRKLSPDGYAVSFVDTVGCGFDEEYNYENRSVKNPGEYSILREILIEITPIANDQSIGIISPYAEQVRFIRNEIQEEIDFSNLDIEINTIDGFQGQEKDIIIISLVRSNDTSTIGFLKDERRLNVAITRARKKLIIIGDSATICSNKTYASLIDHIEQNGGYRSAWEYMSV